MEAALPQPGRRWLADDMLKSAAEMGWTHTRRSRREPPTVRSRLGGGRWRVDRLETSQEVVSPRGAGHVVMQALRSMMTPRQWTGLWSLAVA